MLLALDIDDTIAKTNYHWAKLCYEKHGYSNKKGIEEILQKYEYVRHVPAWQNSTIVADFFNTPEKWLEIPPFEGSSDTTSKYECVFGCYLTTRPSYLRSVTIKWLSENGFPKLPLYMPEKDKNPLEWKAEVLSNMLPKISGIIDDNYELLQILFAVDYLGRVFRFGYERKELCFPKSVFHFTDWMSIRQYLEKTNKQNFGV